MRASARAERSVGRERFLPVVPDGRAGSELSARRRRRSQWWLRPDIPLGHTQTQNTRQEFPYWHQLYFSLRNQTKHAHKKKKQRKKKASGMSTGHWLSHSGERHNVPHHKRALNGGERRWELVRWSFLPPGFSPGLAPLNP